MGVSYLTDPRFSLSQSEAVEGDKYNEIHDWHRGRVFPENLVVLLNQADWLFRLLSSHGSAFTMSAPNRIGGDYGLLWTDVIAPGMRVPLRVSGKTPGECIDKLIAERLRLENEYREGVSHEADRNSEEAGEAEAGSEPTDSDSIPGGTPGVPVEGDIHTARGSLFAGGSTSPVAVPGGRVGDAPGGVPELSYVGTRARSGLQRDDSPGEVPDGRAGSG